MHSSTTSRGTTRSIRVSRTLKSKLKGTFRFKRLYYEREGTCKQTSRVFLQTQSKISYIHNFQCCLPCTRNPNPHFVVTILIFSHKNINFQFHPSLSIRHTKLSPWTWRSVIQKSPKNFHSFRWTPLISNSGQKKNYR